jgi:hypothetical protein
MILVANKHAIRDRQSVATGKTSRSPAWLPLFVTPLGVAALRDWLSPWEFMWSLAFSIYAALKWQTWWRERAVTRPPAWRSAAYLLAWPGMDARAFFHRNSIVTPPRARTWAEAVGQTVLGVTLLWGVARTLPENQPLVRGWMGMLGAVLVLHFGAFRILALIWQRLGVDAAPIMRAPLRSTSLSEFWGKRWNLGFRQLAHDLIFSPLHRKLGVRTASFLVFLVSGLIHDLVISVPARGGYGLPTAYFVLQGAGITMERSDLGKRLGLRNGVRGWLFMAFFTAGPILLLFHAAFVTRVILPFMEAVHAL